MEQELETLHRDAIGAARQYMGHIAWPTVVFVAFVVAAYVANLCLFVTGAMPMWAAIPICGVLTYFSYTPLHEAAHGNIHGTHERFRWLNALCGYLAAPLIWVPYSSHRVEHFTHHRYTNQPDKDPDYVVSGMRGGLTAFVITSLKFLWVQNTFLFKGYWRTAPAGERAAYIGEVVLAIGWRVAVVVLAPRWETVVLLLVGYLAGAFFTAYWFAYRPHVPYQNPARYRNTSSLILPAWLKPLEWFWLGQNIHSIHHLFPRVPFYRYHALHRQIEPTMRAHGTPIIGIFSRRAVA